MTSHNPPPPEVASLSRREFVKTTAATALLSAPFVHAAGSDIIRVGLVGCGGRGTGAASQALNADQEVVLTAMGDMFEDKLSASLKRLTTQDPQRVRVPPEAQFVGFDAYRNVIDSDVDVVILATPPHFRPAHLKAAIDANKHVFTEKPMAVDSAGVRSVLRSVEEARPKNLCVVSGFCWRYSYPERATFSRIADGGVGEVVSVHTAYHAGPLRGFPRQAGWSDMEWQLRNWWHFRWLSGDHIVEQACHSIDKINWAMGGRVPARASALGGRQMRSGPESGNVYDHFTVIYEYDDGARCFHTCRQMPNCAFDNTDYVLGTQGNCFVNGWGPTHVIKGQHPWSYEGEHPNMYQVEHNELFAAIRSGEPINDGIWMMNSNLMAIMGRMAAYSGQVITWEQALNAAEDWTPSAYSMSELEMPPVAVPGAYTIPEPATT
ncbi:MAG: Gfo/Idh/MocA family protein [Planctomycetota bacterium]|jgi:predicted dehydrogenase